MSNVHRTNNPNIFGYIEKNQDGTITGWFINLVEKEVLNTDNFRILSENDIIEFEYGKERHDVCEFYKDYEYKLKNCGYKIIGKLKDKITFEYKTDNGEWMILKELELKPKLKLNPNNSPKLIVVDNFYENPDYVREYALRQEFVSTISSHKGKRTTQDFQNDELKTRFEELLGKRIVKWDYKWNGCFQYCIAEDPLVIHCDVQNYAAMVFLTPNAPPSTGTSFYRHKEMKNRSFRQNTFTSGHYDFTNFDLVDSIGNVYNRLVIFDAQLIHAASEYFGQNQYNGRLFQIFFFDI